MKLIRRLFTTVICVALMFSNTNLIFADTTLENKTLMDIGNITSESNAMMDIKILKPSEDFDFSEFSQIEEFSVYSNENGKNSRIFVNVPVGAVAIGSRYVNSTTMQICVYNNTPLYITKAGVDAIIYAQNATFPFVSNISLIAPFDFAIIQIGSYCGPITSVNYNFAGYLEGAVNPWMTMGGHYRY